MNATNAGMWPRKRGTGFMRFGQLTTLLLGLLGLFFAAGCATSNSGSKPAPPGSGLKEYRQLVLGLLKETAAARQSLETLAATSDNKFPDTSRKLARVVERLEVTSMAARSRADAMEKRGEAYFEEWHEEINALQNEASRRAATQQLAELRQHFTGILDQSRQTRQHFRTFLDGLRTVRTALQNASTRATLEQTKPTASEVIGAGRSAEAAMEGLLTKVRAAEQTVQSIHRPAKTSGAA